jgi:hypothetical protein
MLADLVSMFVSFDDFCKQFEEEISDRQIGNKSESAFSISKIGTILISLNLLFFL